MAELMIEIAYATPEKQKIVEKTYGEALSVRQAVIESGIDQYFPEIDLENVPVGSYGKKIAKPELQKIEQGMRIELYRPLLIDPKQARLNRAAKQAKDAEQS